MQREFSSAYRCPLRPGSASSRRSLHLAGTAASLATAMLWHGAAYAQTLDDKYYINVEAYFPRVDTNVRANATAASVGTDISLERDLDMKHKEVLPAVSAGGRFGRILVGFDYFRLKRTGSVTLQRDIEFDGATYPVDATLNSSFSSDIYRLTVGYAIVRKPNLELGAGLGIHATNFVVSLSGDASVGEESASATTRRKKVLAPLPTVGVFGTWKVAPRVELTGRFDYLKLKISDYDGKLINAQAAVNYTVFKHASIGLAYRYVDYTLGVTKASWNGQVRYKLSGPAVTFQYSF